jgi:aflatoxin B1 aldehyde reductase
MRVILGTMTIGGQADAAVGAAMLDGHAAAVAPAAVEVDTARMYQMPNRLDGSPTAADDVDRSTEAVLGALLAGCSAGGSGAVSLATKANPWPEWDESLSAPAVRLQLETSLAVLGRESVELFYLHAPDIATPIEETLQAVDDMHKEGKLKEFGLSNFAPWEVMEIYHLCQNAGWVLPTVYQGMYNAVTRRTEELFPVLRKCGMRFYAFNLLAGGLLTDKRAAAAAAAATASTAAPPADGGRFDPAQAGPMKIGVEYTARYWRPSYLEAIANLKVACGAASPPVPIADAAQRWLVHHSQLSAAHGDGVIIGASSVAQMEANLAACLHGGPLPVEVVGAFEEAWALTEGSCPTYFSGYSGQMVIEQRPSAKL